MIVEFCGEVVEWRGPAPFFFVRVPESESAAIKEIASRISYGWGCLPCTGKIGGTEFKTALIPRNGLYMVPLKVALRNTEGIEEVGGIVLARLKFDLK